MKKTLAWIPMLLGALVLHGFAELPTPRAREPVATSTGKVLASGAEPVLHYTFGRSRKSVRIKDRSGHRNNGMAVHPLRRVPGIAKGQWAARFDGTGDYIRVPRSASLEPEELTVDAWVRIRGRNPNYKAGAIVFKRNTGTAYNEDYCLEILSDRTVLMTVSSPPSQQGQTRLNGDTVLSPDLWHHLAMTFRPGEAVLYVDGRKEVRMRIPLDSHARLEHNTDADLFIGTRDHATYPLDRFGAFDLAELRIWPKALGAKRIAALYGEYANQPGVAKPPRDRSHIDRDTLCTVDIAPESLVLHLAPIPSCKTSAKVRDRSNRNNHGVATRPLQRVCDGAWRAWRFDSARQDFIRIPRAPSLEPEAITVAVWVRIPGGIEPADAGAVIFKRNNSFHDNEGYNLEILPDRRVRMTIGHSGGQKDVISREVLAPDLWHHVAMTFLGGRMRLYVDGKPAGEARFIQALDHNPSTDLLIGGRDHASHPMDRFVWFDLADLRIWSKALNMHQIAALYGEFADRPKVAHPADNREPAPTHQNADHTFICGTPSFPPSRPVAIDAPDIRRDALVLHYAFATPKDGTELRDRSGHQADGSASRPLEWVRENGNLEGALRFDGVGDHIRVPRSASLEPEAVTVAAWVKIDASRPMIKPGGTVVFKRNPSFYNNEDYQLEIRSNRTVMATCANPSGVQTKAISPHPIEPDVWHHLAMSIGKGWIRLYIDGAPVADTHCAYPLNHNPEADLFIGAKDHVHYPIDHPCPMELADVRIWSAVLNESEIAALYREKALFSEVAKPGMKRPHEPPRVFPPWQPPEKRAGAGPLAAELRALLEQGRLDKAASPEFLDALQRLLDRHTGAPAPSCGCCPMAPPLPPVSTTPPPDGGDAVQR